jgi:glycosyltransferase involved in cell wall biosynthesis
MVKSCSLISLTYKMSNKKTVTHILYSGLGGHGSVFFSLVKADTTNKFNTTAIFCGIEEVRKDYIDQCHALNVPFTAIRKKRGLDLRVYLSIFNALRKARPDVIVLHGSVFILPARLYRIGRRTKIIVRDTQAHHLKNERDWKWFRLTVKLADKLIFLTRESKDGAVEKGDRTVIEQKAVVIPNGLDTAKFKTGPRPEPTQQWIIGMQSRLQLIKDHPTLLKAFALLQQELPQYQLRLRIAGDGDTMNDLVKLAAGLGISADVEFCGMLDEQALITFMHSLDLYAHASLGETMSNSIMQAMACGLPIVASDVWGINNMVDGQNGLLYKSGDAADLCAKLKLLITDPAKRKAFAQAADAYAERELSFKRLFRDYEKIYGTD